MFRKVNNQFDKARWGFHTTDEAVKNISSEFMDELWSMLNLIRFHSGAFPNVVLRLTNVDIQEGNSTIGGIMKTEAIYPSQYGGAVLCCYKNIEEARQSTFSSIPRLLQQREGRRKGRGILRHENPVAVLKTCSDSRVIYEIIGANKFCNTEDS